MLLLDRNRGKVLKMAKSTEISDLEKFHCCFNKDRGKVMKMTKSKKSVEIENFQCCGCGSTETGVSRQAAVEA